ncbi:PAS domain-containing sensor histidine kinase [Leptospira perolatii]|uniref:histidine kinase n=2 Tax=Leptospira perolatii TaxID=2023191 RepID=A0A2M9ZS24_9LEPT|nr:PAS domain-containing sensor histidine kinase [Leptospira perolatii]PJZ74824.1 PAS domain-containing sensor histidine kinase [Leptospira perolatii]
MSLCFVSALLFGLFYPFVAEPPIEVYLPIYALPFILILSHFLLRSGRTKIAAHALIGFGWILAFAWISKEGGIHSVLFSLCIVMIVLSLLVLDEKSTYVYASIAISIAAARMISWDNRFWINFSGRQGDWIMLAGQVLGFVFLILLMRIALFGFRRIKDEISQIQRYAKLGGWTLNTVTHQAILSKEYLALLGEPEAKEIQILSFEEFLQRYVIPEDIPKVIGMMSEALKNRHDPNFSSVFYYRTRLKNGEIRYILVNGKYRDDVVGFGTAQDITEIQIAQEELRRSQELFSKVFQLSPYAIAISTMDEGRYIDVNDGFASLFGYTREEVVGRTTFEINLWVDPEHRMYFVKKLLKDGLLKNEETEYRRKDGRIIQAEFSTRVAIINGQQWLISVVRDLADRKEAQKLRILNLEILSQKELIEKQKRELENTLENLTRTQSQLILSEKMAALGQLVAGIAHELSNPIGVIRSSNELLKIHFAKNEQKIDRAIQILSSLDKEQKEELIRIFEKAKTCPDLLSPKELRLRSKNLESKLMERGFENDIRNLAEGIAENGLDSFLEEFPKLFGSSDSRNVLEFVLEEIQAERHSKLIEMSVDRTSKVVYALRNYSHFDGSGQKSQVCLQENLETVLTIYHNQLKSGIAVTKEYNPVPNIQANSDDLLHVWSNLIYNAAQAMNFSGELLVGVYESGKERVEVQIKDSGPGIPEAIQHRIFEPFFTTKARGQGSGLGLDITRRIVENHKGEIRFETSEKGTTFFVTLPIC